jgi:hypothetical protein
VGLVVLVILANYKYYWCVGDFGTCICCHTHGFLGNITGMISRFIKYLVSCSTLDRLHAMAANIFQCSESPSSRQKNCLLLQRLSYDFLFYCSTIAK